MAVQTATPSVTPTWRRVEFTPDATAYSGPWRPCSAAVDSGTLDPDTLYVTGDADRFASWQAQYGDKADYITWDIAATGIYDRRDEYYFMAPKQ